MFSLPVSGDRKLNASLIWKKRFLISVPTRDLIHVLNWEPVKACEVGGLKGTPRIGSLQCKVNRDVYTENGPSVVVFLTRGGRGRK